MTAVVYSYVCISCEAEFEHTFVSFCETTEGNAEVFKEKVELDDENRTVSFVGVEGDVMKYYKTFKPTFQLTPKGDGCLAKLTIEYEKLRADVSPPDKYFTMMFKMTKDVDAHLVKS